MPWPESGAPVRMERVALVAPEEGLRSVLVSVADAGVVQIDLQGGDVHGQSEAARRLRSLHPPEHFEPLLAADAVDLDALVEHNEFELLAGESQLEDVAAGAVRRTGAAALTGWMPASEIDGLRARIADVGGGIVVLPRPRGIDPPTMLPVRSEVRRSLTPLVQTYGTVPYSDLDPTVIASLSYMAMFGMMFGDVGHGLLLVAMGLLLRAGRPRRLKKISRAWPFVLGAGVAATLAGFLYGEYFGPTDLLPPLWIAPLEQPITLLVTGLGVGAVLLAGAYTMGTVNRWREGGWQLAVYHPSGMAGSGLFLGLGVGAGGWYLDQTWLMVLGIVVWVLGLLLAFAGLVVDAGLTATGFLQSFVELFDNVIRVGSNLLSFARLAAFGLAHAALGDLVWQATTHLGGDGLGNLGGLLAAVLVFVVGNALAFTLEGLVAAVQALRLEYYELFSRVFIAEGRPFEPWHVPSQTATVTSNRSESPS